MKLKDLAGDTKPKPQRDEKFSLSGVPKGASLNQTPFKAEMGIKTFTAARMMVIDFPKPFVDEMNEYIDNTIIPNDEDYSHSLVGQIRQNEKSKQLNFSLEGNQYVEQLKKVLDNCGSTFVQKGYKRESVATSFEAWTVHSYEGDYNPRHSHGCQTPAGLSSILWLKVPEQIANKTQAEAEKGIHHASGLLDGWTQFSWGTNTSQDLYQLKEETDHAMQPKVGRYLIFPKWLNHEVFPFFGEGERRTFVANFNIHDSLEEKSKYSNVLKEKMERGEIDAQGNIIK